MDSTSVTPPPAIPTVRVTSSDDSEMKEKDYNVEEVVGCESEKEWNVPHEDKTARPNDLPIPMPVDFTRKAYALSDYEADDPRALSFPSTPIPMNVAAEVKHMELLRTRSASCLVSSTVLLTPGTDFDSDRDSSSIVMSSADDLTLSFEPQSDIVTENRADSDPLGVLATKKNKKSSKTFRATFKPSKKKEHVIDKSGAIGELALSSMKVGAESLSKDERRKLKARKSMEKRRKKFTKMAQKLSDRQVLSPSYKQKNEDFRKFFKDLPATERLLVDYACALVKDILVQGRIYVSQNYLCFHSNILKWQTAVTVKLVEIDQMTKEKTVKVIPNAIQVLMKDSTKMTFTSFTARDRAYLTIFRLWQNALLDKPISGVELWSQIHRNYGEELGGCSSDDDYIRPKLMPRKHQSLSEVDPDMKYEFGTTNKIKKKKKSSNATQTPRDGDFGKVGKRTRKVSRHSSRDSPTQFQQATDSTADDKSSHSSQGTQDEVDGDVVEENEEIGDDAEDDEIVKCSKEEEESDDEPAYHTMEDCAKVSLNRVYETSARDLNRIIFGDDCPFWKETLVKKGTTNITFGTWGPQEEGSGQRKREMSYDLRLDNAIGPKSSFVKETQILYPCTVEGKTYVVDCIAQNFGIPYADYFQTCMRYSIRKVSKTSCELRVTSELRYRKTPWGLVKNFIEKNVASGLTDNFRKLEYQLQERIDFEKSQPQLLEQVRERKNSHLRRRKRRSETSPAEEQKERSSHPPSPVPNGVTRERGDMRQSSSDLNNNKSGNSSPDVIAGAPPLLQANGHIPNHRPQFYGNESPKLRYFGQGGKFIIGAILFIFILLIYSNYSMYQRLTTLEQVTVAAATADGVDPSVTAALLDRPGVPITSNPEVLSTYLQAIDKRLRRLEDTVVKFTENSNTKWDKLEKNWSALQNMIHTIIKQQGAKGG